MLKGSSSRPAGAAAFALALVVTGAGAVKAAGPPTNLIGKLQSHSFSDGLGHSDESTDPSPTFHFTQSGSRGTIDGSITLTFPADLPPANYDPTGTKLLFSKPWQATMSVQVSWTTPAARSTDDPKTVFDFELDHVAIHDSDHQITPNCDAPLPDEAQLNENTTYSWNQSVSCTFSTLPVFGDAFSPNPKVLLGEQVDYTFAGDAASGFFIDGGVPSVQSSYVFGPATTDLSVDHLEVVQTVQHPDNSEPLAAGKSTVARVFAKFIDTANPPATFVPGVTAKLHGFHGSAELAGSPISPFNPGGAIDVPQALSLDRSKTNHALNFLLPAAWTAPGDLTLTAELNPDKTVPETNYQNNTGTIATPAHFEIPPGFQINYVRVCYPNFSTCPSNAIAGYSAMAQELYPLADTGLVYNRVPSPSLVYPFPLLEFKDQFNLLSFLQYYEYLIEATSPPRTELLGWLPAIPSQQILDGLSDPAFDGGKGQVAFAQDLASFDAPGTPTDQASSSYVLAHETAHNLGLRHTDLAPGGDGCNAFDPGSPFPEYYTDHKATIHEIGFSPARRAAISSSAKDLMTSCTPISNIWLSPFNDEQLFQGLYPSAAIRVRPLATPGQFVLVSGSARLDGSAGQIDSVLAISSSTSAPVSDPSGDYCIRFSSGAASPTSYCFSLPTTAEGQPAPGLSEIAFTVKAPLPAGTTKIVLAAGSNELDSVSKSAHAPVVSITSPHSGDAWSGVKTITWTASDADNDPLTFAIQTSADGGATWLPVAIALSSLQYSLDSAELSAGASTLVRVLASDGFNTTAATAGPFTVTAQAFVEATPELDFGAATAAQPQTLSVLLTNRGTKDAHLTGYQSGNAAFGASAILPLAIPAGGSATLPVTFTPGAAGTFSALLTLATDDPARASLTVALVGTPGDDCRPIATIPCVLPVSTPSPIVTGRR